MKAQHLLLTHFSARYPKLPPVLRRSDSSDDTDAFEPTVAIAFDLATIRLDEFWKMERYREAMDLLFAWDEDAEEEADISVVDQCASASEAVGKGGKKEKKGMSS